MRQGDSVIHPTAAALGPKLTEVLFRWSASAGQLGLGRKISAEGCLTSSGSPGDSQKKAGRHEKWIREELAACLAGCALAGSHSH